MDAADPLEELLVDHELDDFEEDEEDDEDVVIPFTKRKRVSTNYNVEDLSFTKTRPVANIERPVKRQRNPKQPKQQRGVIIGVCKSQILKPKIVPKLPYESWSEYNY